MAPHILRPGTPADAPAVAVIWREGWDDGMRDHVNAALAAARTEASFRTRAERRVGDTVVIEVDGAVGGFFMTDGDELEQIFVDRAHRGTGLAAELLAAAEEHLAKAGHAEIWLAVVPGNERARRFYARNGWRDAGPHPYEAVAGDGMLPVAVHRYTRMLAED
ncbi:N-acetyltransferase family protein [Streptomyces boninensis]|uniref:GNAT family N-acetyltransferase n=1 Tax=Streptomyces boninensis TaxID=2039455 RepID=UPI003B21C4DA